jgi:hypothetical protein
MQNYSFKSDVPPEVQQRLFDHQLATEMLIMEACRKNPRFAVETAKIAQFPLLYNLSAEDYMVMDAARTGNPLTLQQVAILYSGGVKKLQMAMATGEVPLPGAAAASGSAGGFNAATNGVGGMSEAGGNSPKVNTLASPEKVDTMAAPRQPPNLQ